MSKGGCSCCNNTNQPTDMNNCGCDFITTIVGLCDFKSIQFSNANSLGYRKDYNWTEISIPEILKIPSRKPDIEQIDKVLIKVEVTCAKLVETPKYLAINNSAGIPVYATDDEGFAIPIPNAEGTYMTGRKLIVEGILKQKIVYTADVAVQSVHSAHYEIPFNTFIIVYPKFLNDTGGGVPVATAEVDLGQDFCIDACIEDVHAQPLDKRTIFKSVTLFLRAKPAYVC